jgi:Dyp-type peroxidase family
LRHRALIDRDATLRATAMPLSIATVFIRDVSSDKEIHLTIDLSKPLEWTNATHDEQKMLRALQGNILKGHGRDATVNVFFRIDPAKKHVMRAALRELANFHATSAYQQLLDTEKFHTTGEPGGPFVSVFLSATGYAALGVPAPDTPSDPGFQGGMKNAGLGDPAVASWETEFQSQVDGMALIATDNDTELRRTRDAVVTLLRDDGGATIVKEQRGNQIRNAVGVGIEHFGYVDGRSQPLPLVEDLTREAAQAGISQWDPQSTLGVALIEDPGSTDGISFGSYFIFRKLEQNVRDFKRQEQQLATALNLKGEGRELAGALAVGRFEDGTPVTLSEEARALTPPNDFNYDADPGIRCPFHAHIRKTNPRGSGGFEAPADERKHLMIRRGITYEDAPRTVHPTDIPASDSVSDFNSKVAPLLPTGGVGLLFMAYNHTLAVQFEFTQKAWANNPGFPRAPAPTVPGIDPVIGQAPGPAAPHDWPKTWDDAAQGTVPLPFQDFVKMRGGEYFFAPSLNFLKRL